MRQALQFSGSPEKDFKSLISSIQDKLSQLAADESAAPQAMLSQHPHSPSHSLLVLEDLSPAYSPVLEKLGRIQAEYMNQIAALHQKVSMMEAQNFHLNQLNASLQSSVVKLQCEVKRLEKAVEGNMISKMEEIEVNLARRWRVEVQQEIGNYVRQLESMREQICQLRRGNRELLKQKEIFMMERDNLDYLYRQILNKYKMTLQADIECFERGQVGQERTAHSTRAHQGEIIASRKSKKKQFKSPELTRDQLVPFLAKGIEELREKLKMKKL